MAAPEEREFDIIVFGASGFTGQYVVEELARVAKDEGGFKWAIAGRNRDKLKAVLETASEYLGENLTSTEIVEADVKDSESLHDMCRRTKLVLNCVGPYRFFGEAVVEACVIQKTHHVDVSGEPQYLETMQLKYFDKAKEGGYYIVGACGFDSIPCDMGVTFLKQKFEGDVNSVETYLSFKNGPKGRPVNFGTWHSAIYGFAHGSELKGLRKQLNENLFKKEFPKGKYPLSHRPVLFKSDISRGWCLPFPGSDRSVTLRSQRFNYEFLNEKPVQIYTYIQMPSILAAFFTIFVAVVFGIAASFKFGRTLLEKFPEVFSFGMFTRKGPTREQVLDSSFKMILNAEGWKENLAESTDHHTEKPDKFKKIMVKGPDAAYITTAICMVQAGVVIIKESDKMPLSGGVLTPGAAFGKTSLVERLHNRGIEFSVLQE